MIFHAQKKHVSYSLILLMRKFVKAINYWSDLVEIWPTDRLQSGITHGLPFILVERLVAALEL